jgi:tetrahydromethanopterin S-methyltransferase subunit H
LGGGKLSSLFALVSNESHETFIALDFVLYLPISYENHETFFPLDFVLDLSVSDANHEAYFMLSSSTPQLVFYVFFLFVACGLASNQKWE